MTVLPFSRPRLRDLLEHWQQIDLCVMRGRIERTVPQHGADGLKRRTAAQHGGCCRVAEKIAAWFGDLYSSIGLEGCSSHSGRRTFIARTARKIGQVGGSLRDVQYIAGHASLTTTQIYIDGDSEAQRKVIELI
jgi:integrase